jgi:hypothetical protein
MTFSPAVAAEIAATEALSEIQIAAHTDAAHIDHSREHALRRLEINCADLGYANAAYVARVTASALRARELELAQLLHDQLQAR